MNRGKPKRPPVRLATGAYEQLRLRVIKRDGWRCQNCGSSRNLHVYHQLFRSQAGDDSESNLITLCSSCHLNEHRSSVTPEGG